MVVLLAWPAASELASCALLEVQCVSQVVLGHELPLLHTWPRQQQQQRYRSGGSIQAAGSQEGGAPPLPPSGGAPPLLARLRFPSLWAAEQV